MRRLFLGTLPLLLAACAPWPEGLRATPDGPGPTVVVDWDAEPLPEIPFPNDLATRMDPSSPTGLRLNISELAPTLGEREARQKLNEMTGFGVYAPITVAFDGRLDIDNILARHPNDFERGAQAFADDAFYLIDVDPKSPDYLSPVALDVGHGRYVYESESTDKYFVNDARADQPSLVFETAEEDTDGDGVMDPGEDTDNDGVLDHPNVWPPGGDPRRDLLTFYELETNTLILRPVVPLREEGRYAVVLTERLVDEDGAPVHSPWQYVNHTRQTAALEPLRQALPQLGLSVNDVAFAWTFSTGRVTGDLVDLHRGLVEGEGPFAAMKADYPAHINEALPLHELDGMDARELPTNTLVSALATLGVLEGNEALYLQAAYATYGGMLVGGSFETPYLLADRDDGDLDAAADADEWWQVDPMTGQVSGQRRRLVFTCAIPGGSAEGGAPWPVAFFGHGHGGSRVDVVTFGWALNRMGIALCGVDFPGHGVSLPDPEMAMVRSIFASQGMEPALDHLLDHRARDLTNDGVPDSGADQWISDPFHTRDMVRQSTLDWTQFIRALKGCGQGDMNLVAVGGAVEGKAVSCDWDGDGTADLGGPDADYFILGGSLGGIDTAVAAGVMPEVSAFVPIVPGGGLLDISIRSELGGVVSAVVGRMLSPLFVGLPNDAGGLDLAQVVNAYGDMNTVVFHHLPAVPAGGHVRVEDLDDGEVREGMIPADGRFRISIPCDALDPVEKRLLVGMPDTGPEVGTTYEVPDNEGLGDRIRLTITDAAGATVAVVDTFADETVYEGVTMRAGSPLVAASHGSGYVRGSPGMRRLAMVMAMALEPADPIVYARHWFLEPFPALGGKPANVLEVPTIGDQGVSISTGIALARAAGFVDWQTVDDRYGMTPDQWLIDRQVIRAIEGDGPYTCIDGNPCLFDPDDLDEGTDEYGAPSEAPLRATVESAAGVSALRLPYPEEGGRHFFSGFDPSRPFDGAAFTFNQMSWYLHTRGAELRDDVCLGTDSCDFLPPVEWTPEGSTP